MIALKEKLTHKRSMLNNKIMKKSLMLRKRNERQRENIKQVIHLVSRDQPLDWTKKKEEDGYLGKINKGILKRYEGTEQIKGIEELKSKIRRMHDKVKNTTGRNKGKLYNQLIDIGEGVPAGAREKGNRYL